MLERASLLKDSGVEVPVEFRVEPENPYDPNFFVKFRTVLKESVM